MKQESLTEQVDLFQEIYNNVVEDRARIKAATDRLNKGFTEDSLDPIGSSEILAKLQECLTRSNGQLVDLYRASLKRAPTGKNQDDPDNIYDEIETKDPF